MSKRCFHCASAIAEGTEVSAPFAGEMQPFCCHACLGVATLIHQHHLNDYYRVRDHSANRPPSRFGGQQWQAYDLPEIADQYVYHDNAENEVHLYIDGIHCAACSWLIRGVLKERLGLENVRVNTTTARAEIRYQNTPLSAILATIAELGYTPNLFTPQQNEQQQNRIRNQYLLRLIVSGLGMMQVMMFATGLYIGDFSGIEQQYSQLLRWISFSFTTPVFFYAGWPFLQSAWLGLKVKRANMDLPVALAITGAYFASTYHTILGQGEIYFDSVTMFIFFLSISRFLEFLTRRRAQLNEIQFARLLPEAVEKYNSKQLELHPLAAVQIGDVLRILPGQTIAVDGEIVHGQSRVDESMLSGESRALRREVGEQVLAGSHNLESPLDVKVTATGQATTLAGIRRLVARAEQHRGMPFEKSQWLAQKTIIAVVLLALGGYLLWQWIDPARAFEIALAILVATCPCALSLATPATLTAAMNHAHRAGILIKESETLDRLRSIRHLLFDKTGTLTEGNFQLLDQEIYHPDASFIWRMAKSLQRHSAHPIAWLFAQRTVDELPLTEVRQMPGQGVQGRYQGRLWVIGSAGAIQTVFPDSVVDAGSIKSGVAVFLANEEGIAARFVLDDPLRSNMAGVIASLSNHYDIQLASGDQRKNVERVAEAVGIGNYHAEQSPQDKLNTLAAMGEDTLMIGDGINDAPVMAAASVSVAVGKADPLSQTQADIVFLRHGPEALPFLFALAEKTQRVIRQNLFWAVAYNAVVLPLAIAGYLTPWLAALGMSASSLIVVFNALRVSRIPLPEDKA